MGFDMCIIKINKKIVEETLNKYYQKDLVDLPYDVFERILNHSDTKHFTSRVNILRDIEENYHMLMKHMLT